MLGWLLPRLHHSTLRAFIDSQDTLTLICSSLNYPSDCKFHLIYDLQTLLDRLPSLTVAQNIPATPNPTFLLPADVSGQTYLCYQSLKLC